jgi:hypothetical protein
MDMGVGVRSPGAIDENNQQKALLAWATDRIDHLANDYGQAQRLGELLDWLAYFTREHFGLQQRLLNECSKQREYLLDRVNVHCRFRRRLAQLCIDTMRRDPSVPERLCALCHDLLADAQAQQDVLANIVREAAVGPKLRKKPRHGELATLATELFESRSPASAGEAATTH